MKKQLLSTTLFIYSILWLTPSATAHSNHDANNTMQAAAELFIKSLDAQRRPKAIFEFQSNNRKAWNYLPDKYIKPDGKRYGLTIKEMSPKQRIYAYGLLNSALSQKGSLTVNTVMMLEQFLHELENKNPIRDPELFYVSIFGTPSKSGSWGWRFEGHHLSINVTLVNGQQLALTPIFLGGNPGFVKDGPYKGLRVLGQEEILARQLAVSLTPSQSKEAVISAKAPGDIHSKNKQKIDRSFYDLKKGIPYASLEATQQQKLKTLINVYIKKFRPELINSLKSSPLSETDSMTFAWAGSLEAGKGHYYRIVTKNHLIEYDNVQNKANHPHCVWRLFDGDFGVDMLKEHREKHH